ncbi:MAG: hypothetical protein WD605_02165, partial [Candidatus Paceibacterota bacterium]
MLLMRNSKHKTLLVFIFGTLLVVGLVALYWLQKDDIQLSTTLREGNIVEVTIPDGLRKEQTADTLAGALNW